MLRIQVVPRRDWLLARLREGWMYWLAAPVALAATSARASRRGWDMTGYVIAMSIGVLIMVGCIAAWEGGRREAFRRRGGVASVVPTTRLLEVLGPQPGAVSSPFAKAGVVDGRSGLAVELDGRRWLLAELGVEVTMFVTRGGSAVAAAFERGNDLVRVSAQRRLPERLRPS